MRCNESVVGVSVGFVLGFAGPPSPRLRKKALRAAAISASPSAITAGARDQSGKRRRGDSEPILGRLHQLPELA